jgi:hypothetical protein
MNIIWRRVVAQRPHPCQICHRQIEAREECWIRRAYNTFLRVWENTFICNNCEWALPKKLREEPRPKPEQLDLFVSRR